MSQKKRIFIAIKPTDSNLSQLLSIQQLLQNLIPKCRPLSSQNIHMTTHFIGEIDVLKVNVLIELLKNETLGKKHFQYLNEPAIFPNYKNARVIGVGSSVTSYELEELYTKVTKIINSIGLKTERRPFYPHITLFRMSSACYIDKESLRRAMEERVIKFEVSGLFLYESKLEKSGARYEIIEKFELAD